MLNHKIVTISAFLMTVAVAGCSSTGSLFSSRNDTTSVIEETLDTKATTESAAAPAPAPETVENKMTVRDASDTRTFEAVTSIRDDDYRYRETVVTKKIRQLNNDRKKIARYVDTYDDKLDRIRVGSEDNAQKYYSVVAKINARLQRGTTPGNPILIDQMRVAQQHLDNLANAVATLNKLANDISTNASVSSYLLEAVRASYGLTGAVEEDHIALEKLEDEVNRLVVRIDRQMNEVSNSINRRASYLASERRNLQTLALAVSNGELYGQSLANRSFFSPSSRIPGADEPLNITSDASLDSYATDTPLVVIRFDRTDVDYEQAIYLASSQALERYPSVGFEIVAVAPTGLPPSQMSLTATDARNNAEAVYRSMTQMGIPGNRLSLSATRSPNAETPEVHIFLK